MRGFEGFLRKEITGWILVQAVLVLAPLVLLATLSGNPIWLRAAILTISTYIGFERSGLAPLGVVLHGRRFSPASPRCCSLYKIRRSLWAAAPGLRAARLR